MHDGACTLSTTSTPCAYLHTQSCLVSPPPEDLLLAVELQSLSFLFRGHMCEPSVLTLLPPRPPHSDGEEEILGSLVYDVIL